MNLENRAKEAMSYKMHWREFRPKIEVKFEVYLP